MRRHRGCGSRAGRARAGDEREQERADPREEAPLERGRPAEPRSSSRASASSSPVTSASTKGEAGPARPAAAPARRRDRDRPRPADPLRERRELRGIHLEPDRREHLGGDELGAGLVREPLSRDAPKRSLHVAPLGLHAPAAPGPEALRVRPPLVFRRIQRAPPRARPRRSPAPRGRAPRPRAGRPRRATVRLVSPAWPRGRGGSPSSSRADPSRARDRWPAASRAPRPRARDRGARERTAPDARARSRPSRAKPSGSQALRSTKLARDPRERPPQRRTAGARARSGGRRAPRPRPHAGRNASRATTAVHHGGSPSGPRERTEPSLADGCDRSGHDRRARRRSTYRWLQANRQLNETAPTEPLGLSSPQSECRRESLAIGCLVSRAKDPALPDPPSFYVRRNCWYGVSFPLPREIEGREIVGVEKLLWGNDHPHYEGC